MRTQRQRALRRVLSNQGTQYVRTQWKLPVEALLDENAGFCFEINTSCIKIAPNFVSPGMCKLEEQFQRFALIAGLRERDLQDYGIELHIPPAGPIMLLFVDEEVYAFCNPRYLYIEVQIHSRDRNRLYQYYQIQLLSLLGSRFV